MVHLLGLVILGLSLLWSLRLVYGRRRVLSSDPLMLILTQASWILVFLGLGLVCGPLVLVIGLVVGAMVVARYRHSERRALLWVLAVAADRCIPLAEAARSFAAGRMDETGHRAAKLADCLDRGMPLPVALDASRNPLPKDADLAARLGYATDSLDVTLRDAAREGDRFASITYANYSAFLYILVAINIMIGLIAFVMVSVVPTYSQILSDFEIEIPWITRLVIQSGQLFVSFAWLLAPVLLVAYAVLLYALVGYMGFRVPPVPFLGAFFPRNDGAVILKSLGAGASQQRPILQTIELLARWYPQYSVGTRLAKAADRIRTGHHWCDSIRSQGLISESEAAVLKAAERVGNLTWACYELADANSRRTSYRAAAFSRCLGPLLALLIGVPVAVFAVAMMVPLISLIEVLTV